MRARRARWAGVLALVVVGSAGSAEAKPKRRDAKAAFDRGVAAYQKGNFEAASEALGKSFALERDVDTLFAWAQAERKLDHCDKALELYDKLLASNLPAANRTAVELKVDECRAMIAQPRPGAEPPLVEARTSEPIATEARPQPVTEPRPKAAEVSVGSGAVVEPPPQPPIVETPGTQRAWYKDPVALSLGGVGVVATGVGGWFLVSGNSLGSDSKSATDYQRASDLRDKARLRGNIGGVTMAVGGAALIGAVVWVVTHRPDSERPTVTGWLGPDGGGLAVAGAL